jgi:23S rRNA pseudouridine2605 synthase
MTERLQKFLAGAGVASRRKAEEMVAAGRVMVNGVVVREMGTRVDPKADHVLVDGRAVETGASERYILLYKPPGCVTTLSDPQGRPTVARYLTGVTERVFPGSIGTPRARCSSRPTVNWPTVSRTPATGTSAPTSSR